jgi:site-specific DNA-methyltransferase (adenine-specific)
MNHMTTKLNYNPDVLDALANLSNDEVFTPPKLVNEVLDMLPNELWSDKNATFLDPATKSGVFLREIAKRLIEGLEKEIPDLQDRLNHIYTNQLSGIGITELTSLLARRSLYCSKIANHEKYSVCTDFENENGNIRFERIEHTWRNGKCEHCGASEGEYDRDESLETHAYEFIHKTPEEIISLFNKKDMKFDVIIGNPPYQLGDGGGTGSSAMPIYQKFVEQAKKMQPRFLSMVIPSRWFTGGRGLDAFREAMLNDKRVRELHDYYSASDVFPGVEIKGGVCYFLWERDSLGLCKVVSHEGGIVVSEKERPLLQDGQDVFVRYTEAISILEKVSAKKESSFADLVSPNDPFGFDIREKNSYKRIKPKFKKKPFEKGVKFYYNGWKKEGVGYIDQGSINKNLDWIKKIKVYVPKAWGTGNSKTDWVNPFLESDPSCSTETYLVLGPFKTKKEAKNVISYTQTRFFHFLVSLIKNTQNTMQKAYTFIPMQDFSELWTDEKLYKKYKLTKEEIDFIESMIRPIE